MSSVGVGCLLACFLVLSFSLQSFVGFYFPSLVSGILAVRYAHRGEGWREQGEGEKGKTRHKEFARFSSNFDVSSALAIFSLSHLLSIPGLLALSLSLLLS